MPCSGAETRTPGGPDAPVNGGRPGPLGRGPGRHATGWISARQRGIKDITAGYRAYRADALAELDLDAIESKGYCFQIDMSWRLLSNGRRVVEVPITFTERTVGHSKMSESIFREAAVNVARWGWEKRRAQLRALIGR